MSTTSLSLDVQAEIERKTKFHHQKDSFLEKVGVIGYDKISTPLFVSIMTGYPICLLGPAGTAKTFAISQVAKYMLSYSIICIDCSKANWEELVGPYNFKEYVENGNISYLPAAQTLWGKDIIFWDEINRGGDKIQNGALEVTRNKRLMGVPLSVQINMAACNPLGYQDTRPLNEALADRFLFVVDVPTLHELGEDNLYKVAEQAESSDDARISKFIEGVERKSEQYSDISGEVHDYLCNVGNIYKDVQNKVNIVKYCTTFCLAYAGELKKKEKEVLNGDYLTFEGRRFNYLIKAISSALAFELYEYFNHISSLSLDKRDAAKLSKTEMDSWMHQIIYKTVRATINTALTGKKISDEILLQSHNLALQCINSDAYNLQYRILKESDTLKRFFLSALYIKEEPLAIYDAYDMLIKNVPNDDNLTEEDLVYSYNINNVEKEDYLLPLFMLYDPISPLHDIYKNMPKELQEKIDKNVECSYKYEFIETIEDLKLPEIIEYFGRKTFDKYTNKTKKNVFTDEFLSLSKDEQFIREMAFRRFLVDNDQYFVYAAVMGAEEQKDTDEMQKKIYDLMIKEQEVEERETILPNFKNAVHKASLMYKKLKEVMKEEGKTYV
jgi:MoxR-like ATPase